MTNKDNERLDSRCQIVVKANDLIQKSRFSLTIQQQKIIAYIVSQLSPYDEDFKLYEFNIVKFCNVCGIDSQNGTIYKNLKEHIKTLSDKSIWVKLENGKETLLRWIEKPYIDEKSGIIKIRMDSDMKPYLLKLTENFTSYELGYTLNFSSKYSFRLYEFIKSIHYNKLQKLIYRIDLETLKDKIDAQNYNCFKDFNKRALKPAITEINTYSDIIVSYNSIYKGRKIVALEIIAETKKPIERYNLINVIKGKTENE